MYYRILEFLHIFLSSRKEREEWGERERKREAERGALIPSWLSGSH